VRPKCRIFDDFHITRLTPTMQTSTDFFIDVLIERLAIFDDTLDNI